MVSVIVPVYKSEATLSYCVQTLLEQKDVELEILLVDDGSPDKCPQICDQLAEAEERIRVIHKENGGVSSARNAGIEAAKGEYLVFVDSDDFAEPVMISRLLKGMEDSDIAICGYHHHYLGRDVEKIPEVHGETGADNFLQLYGSGYMNMPWNKLYRRKLVGRFDESLSLGEDLLFNLDYLRRADGVTVVSEPLYHYIQNNTGNTLSSQKREDKLELGKRIWRETSKFYEELAGYKDQSGIINARLIQEVLDDVESLPTDTGRTKEEKLAVIRSYCQDEDLREAGSRAALQALDYKVIHFCMRRNWIKMTYLLCRLRAWIAKRMYAGQQ